MKLRSAVMRAGASTYHALANSSSTSTPLNTLLVLVTLAALSGLLKVKEPVVVKSVVLIHAKMGGN